MKKIFLLLLMSLFTALTVYGKKSPAMADSINPKKLLQGTWKLDSVDIKQITEKGDSISLPYSKEEYMNSADCIFPVLKIEEDKCIVEKGEIEDIIMYTCDNVKKEFTLWYSVLSVFKYDFPSENTMSLSRDYTIYDADKEESITKSVRLIYTND
jgi:hypothetical protein